MTDPFDTVREALAWPEVEDEALAALASLQAAYEAMERERDEGFALNDSLKERVGEYLARAEAAERERDTALEAMKEWNEQAKAWERKSFDAHKEWRKDAIALDAAERERDELREAIASALTSLATGPAKDGYAYAVLFTASGKDKP